MTKKILLRVYNGKLVPADAMSEDQLRSQGLRVGDTVYARLTRPRNPAHNRFAHAFGRLVVENIPGFEALDAHTALKRLQYESSVECDEMQAIVPGVGPLVVRMPKSLSFASMDQARFETLLQELAQHVAEQYWSNQVDADEVLAMAEEIIGGTA